MNKSENRYSQFSFKHSMILADSSVNEVNKISDFSLLRIPVVYLIGLAQENFRNCTLNQLIWSFIDQNWLFNRGKADNHWFAGVDGFFAEANFGVKEVNVLPVANDVVEWHFFNELCLKFTSNFVNYGANQEKVGVPNRIVFESKFLNAFSSQ